MTMEIIASIGPRCRTVEVLRGLMKVGMTGVRLNLAHSSIIEYQELIGWCSQSGMSVVFDLQGEDFRVGSIKHDFRLSGHAKVKLCLEEDYLRMISKMERLRFDDEDDDGEVIDYLPVKGIDDLNQLYEGDRLYISKNKIAMKMVKRQLDYMDCEVINAGGIVRSDKSITFTRVDRSNKLTEKDKGDLALIKSLNGSTVVHNFTEYPDEILEVREFLGNESIKVFCKIQSESALKNWRSLRDVSDGVLFDRNDVSTHVGYWGFPASQNRFINAIKKEIKPIWVTGGLLDTMMSQNIGDNLPSLSELGEIGRMVKSGVTGFCLSETGLADRPKRVVKAMDLVTKRV